MRDCDLKSDGDPNQAKPLEGWGPNDGHPCPLCWVSTSVKGFLLEGHWKSGAGNVMSSSIVLVQAACLPLHFDAFCATSNVFLCGRRDTWNKKSLTFNLIHGCVRNWCVPYTFQLATK